MNDKSAFKLFYFTNEKPLGNPKEVFRRLRSHSKTLDHPLLHAFITEATAVVREELRQAPDSLRSQLPPFENIVDLAELLDWQQGAFLAIFETVFLCLLQLSLVIGYFEKFPNEFALSKSTSCFTGIGPGLLAAAAVAASLTLSDLPKLGREMIRVALRFGMVTDEVTQSIEPREPGGRSEGISVMLIDVPEETVQKELDAFNKSTRNPRPSHIYISVIGEGSVTISGPPSKLRRVLRESDILRCARYTQLPVYGGLAHASHLYNENHCIRVTSSMDSLVADRVMGDAPPLLSPGDGSPFPSNTPRQLFQSAVSEILTAVVCWNKALESALDIIPNTSTTGPHLFALNPGRVVTQMVNAGAMHQPQCDFQTHIMGHWVFSDSVSPSTLRREDSPIAIVGMSCRFPGGADDVERFWELLEDGRDVHKKVPADRFDVDLHCDPTGKRKNTSLTPFGCFIDQPGLFDAGFFDMSPREAANTDPMHRLALVTAYEALEQSGFVLNRTPATHCKRVGTFYGQASDDYREASSGQNVDTYYITGGCRAFATGRINYFFKFSGPSFNCDTACSSGLASIQMACTSLLHGDADTVVAGGLNVLCDSDGFTGLSRGHFLSKTGGCKTFDCNADGYCRGDGVGSVVMKRLDDAQRDNDNILGVILASATNHSANAISITHPHAQAQADLFRHILTQSGVSPLEVDYVEMHGTGTQAGDAVEMESVTSVFSPGRTMRPHSLHIGSVKGNIGHGEAAAGVTALIKTLLAFQKQAIPKHVGIKTMLNPKFPDLDSLNIHIALEQVPWPRDNARIRYALVNNFGASGGNTSLLLQEPPVQAEPDTDPRTAHVVAVTAKSKVSLRGNLERLLAYLESRPASVDLAHLSYTTMARRTHYNHRIVVHSSSQEEVTKRLREALPTVDMHRPLVNLDPSMVFVFSGQGGFYTGIGSQLYESHPTFRTEIHRLVEICESLGFPSFLSTITGNLDAHEVESQPVITNLAIVCVGIALCRLWDTLGVRPCVVVGASLGEFVALYAAGVLSATDAIYLVGQRAQLLQEQRTANTHSMLAVRASVDQVAKALDRKPYELACVNGTDDVTISGATEIVAELRSTLEAHGYRCAQLDIPYAFHTAQMDPILDQLEEIAEGVTFHDPSIPVVSPVEAACVFDGKTLGPSYIRDVTRRPVQFVDALKAAQDLGLVDEMTIWVEIGPRASYSHFVRSVMAPETVTVPSLKKGEDNWLTLARGMAQMYSLGVPINWQEWHAPFESQLRLLELPSYQWNAKNHWIPYTGNWRLYKGDVPPAVVPSPTPSALRTSLVHRLVKESIKENEGEVVVQSDILQPEFLEEMKGHLMNGHPVATMTIHSDIAFTVATYLFSRLRPRTTIPGIDVKNMHFDHGLIARTDRSQPQCIQVRGVADLKQGSVQLSWYEVDENNEPVESPFVTAEVEYGDPAIWLQEWAPSAHLVTSRIEVLNRMADEGQASRLSSDMAYELFNNLVDYADKFRGMRTVVLNGMEAVANICLSTDTSGKWTVPPHYIDSLIHLAGFILNGGNALNPRRDFYVTASLGSLRFAGPLVPGGRYVSYVKMFPVPGESGFYAGDVYILQNDRVVGLAEGMTFRTFRRVLLNKFFSPPDAQPALPLAPEATSSRPHYPSDRERSRKQSPGSSSSAPASSPEQSPSPKTDSSRGQETRPSVLTPDSSRETAVVRQAIALIAAETGIEESELTNETEFASIGVDSLLSLVLAERFVAELKINMRSSMFLDCPTIGDLKEWIVNYC
ncbi:polyketide synthase [Aspergillus terreus]|uniref:Polyketide synthase n=1 Tax=Aspergillus terreus TaxID=33178 RepID=A0A5M3YYV8_ASPTE|nr:hypothetical protein ATETN484_0004053400 [Aspergillus terreus]GFF13423.1 polyketide synthase [Aspergillus terreus]